MVNFQLNILTNLQFKFSFKYLGQFTVYSISNINFCFLINKVETYVKTKYNVSFLKLYLDSDETKVTSDDKFLPSAIDEKLHGIVNADLPSLTHYPQNEVFHEGFLQQMRPNRRKLRVWSHLLKKSFMENFIFCAVTDQQMLIEQRIENHAITNLPNEILEMILVNTVKSSKNSAEICVIFSQTGSRFNGILKWKKRTM